jgi:hypothetical protein
MANPANEVTLLLYQTHLNLSRFNIPVQFDPEFEAIICINSFMVCTAPDARVRNLGIIVACNCCAAPTPGEHDRPNHIEISLAR